MEDTPLSFWEHLEELRLRLIKSLIAVACSATVGYYFVDPLLAFLSKPVGRFIFLAPTEAFFVRLKIALAAGFILAMPVVLYQLWKFVVIALTPVEKQSMTWILPSSYLLFIAGFSFGFFVLVPAGIKFLLGYSSPVLVPTLSIETYVNFVGVMCLVLGGLFQMPLVSYFLARVGLAESKWLSSQRRIAVLVIYIIGAFLTPGPDPITAILLAVPTYLLYEASILTAKAAERRWNAG